MRLTRFMFLMLVVATAFTTGPAFAEPKPTPYSWIEGQAIDTGFGACLLQSPITAIFIKGIEEWMPGMAGNGNASKYLCIGQLQESFDLPTTTNPAEARKKAAVAGSRSASLK